MIDQNGIYTILTLNDALTIVSDEAQAAGISIETGSVEEQIQNWLAQLLVESDSAMYALYVKQFNPTGPDIDLQNPGTPRLQATVSSGYLKIDNSANGSPVTIPVNSTFTAPNNNIYTNGLNSITVAANSIGFVSVTSVLTGSNQNLPSGMTFVSSFPPVITNPQPFVTGTDMETDAEYTSRIIFLKTNNTSEQATPSAVKELLEFYSAARFYVNNTANNFVTPVPVPSGGYVAVVLFPSGVNAGVEEIQNAIQILDNRFEFGNILVSQTALHPLLMGIIYTGTFPQTFTVAPAQAVQVTLTANLYISFSAGTASAEKLILAQSFATAFVQNLINFYGGAQGNYNLIFQETGSPIPSPVSETPVVSASIGQIKIGPVVAIEQIRSFISDNVAAVPNLNYLQCFALQAIIDPLQAGQPTKILNIDAPSGGHLSVIDFVEDSLFTDNTSWYDRYIFLDPALITVTVTEI